MIASWLPISRGKISFKPRISPQSFTRWTTWHFEPQEHHTVHNSAVRKVTRTVSLMRETLRHSRLRDTCLNSCTDTKRCLCIRKCKLGKYSLQRERKHASEFSCVTARWCQHSTNTIYWCQFGTNTMHRCQHSTITTHWCQHSTNTTRRCQQSTNTIQWCDLPQHQHNTLMAVQHNTIRWCHHGTSTTDRCHRGTSTTDRCHHGTSTTDRCQHSRSTLH